MINLIYTDVLPFIGDNKVVYQLEENGKRYIWQPDKTTYLELDMLSYESPLEDL